MPRIDQYRFYTNALKQHGPSPRGVAWSDARRQCRRFAALLEATGPLASSTLVDAGCGVGELWLYMREQGKLPRRYIGLDTHPEMVRLARERTGQTILCRDILTDPLPPADWYLLSGTLNLLTRFETLLAIRRCFDAAARGIVFNLLEGPDRSDTYNYWHPRQIQRACAPLGRVTLYRGYLDGDMTLKVTG